MESEKKCKDGQILGAKGRCHKLCKADEEWNEAKSHCRKLCNGHRNLHNGRCASRILSSETRKKNKSRQVKRFLRKNNSAFLRKYVKSIEINNELDRRKRSQLS